MIDVTRGFASEEGLAVHGKSNPDDGPSTLPRPDVSPVTEQINPRTLGLDQMSTLDAARAINEEDRGVAEAVRLVIPEIARAVDLIVERLKAGGRLFYVGTGTSGRLGVLDASECPPTFGVAPDLVQGIIAGGFEACYRAVEASEDDDEAAGRDLAARGVTAGDVVVGVTASGATPYTLGAIRWARVVGCATVAVTCNAGTPIAREVGIAIEPVVGPEAVAGSTRMKAGTAQKLVLNMLSTLTMVKLGYVLGNRMAKLQTRNRKLVERAAQILQDECGVGENDARATLEAAGGQLPLALVMLKLRVGIDEARSRLDAAGGAVAEALRTE